MTRRLLRHLHRDVTKPVLRLKRDIVRVAFGGPRRRDEPVPAATPRPDDRPAPRPTEAAAPRATKPEAKPRTKADLYEEATRRGVEGRSKMTKAELQAALDALGV